MRYDADHAGQTRRRILSAAATAIREHGVDGVSVAQVMALAGLTHGGFYAHFASKDDLVAAAIDEMFAQARSRFAGAAAGAQGLARYVDAYLSRRHRDARGTGCPLPALAADAARLGQVARARYGQGVVSLTASLAAELDRLGIGAEAASVVAEMAGAVALSRAVDDPAQSDAILAASRAAVKRRLGLETQP